MKNALPFLAFFFSVLAGAISVSCESRQQQETTAPTPQVFVPAPSSDIQTAADSFPNQPDPVGSQVPLDDPKPMPPAIKRPVIEELKLVTPEQVATRALNNDAMKAFSMKPEAFAEFMKSRIPYYQGKGNLQTANDVVKIEINATEMTVETMKGRQVFPMQ